MFAYFKICICVTTEATTKLHLLNSTILCKWSDRTFTRWTDVPLYPQLPAQMCASFHQSIPEHISELVTYSTHFYQPIYTTRSIAFPKLSLQTHTQHTINFIVICIIYIYFCRDEVYLSDQKFMINDHIMQVFLPCQIYSKVSCGKNTWIYINSAKFGTVIPCHPRRLAEIM